ncbi:hypothetical protein P9112_012481 [Eukaryota sp. TZLM1-RC]
MKVISLHRKTSSKYFWLYKKLTETISHLHLRLILFVAGFVSIKVKGKPRPTDVRVFVSNHSSWIDTLILASKLFPSFIAKNDVKVIPLVSPVAKSWLCLFIDRASREERDRALEKIKERVLDCKLPPLIIFPEGGTSNGLFICKFQKGAFVSGQDVQPIMIRYPCEIKPVGEGAPLWFSIWIMLCQPWSKAEVEFFDTYSPSDEEKEDPQLFANNVRSFLSHNSGVQLCDQGFREKAAFVERYGVSLTGSIVQRVL